MEGKMMDAISRSALLAMMDKYIDMAQDDEMHHAMCAVAEGIKEATALDVAQVVRCKDCKHWKPCEVKGFEGHKYCEWAGWLVGDNGYCVYGEVKKDG